MKLEDLVSVDRRRRRWRPKPIAWVILVIIGLLLIGALAWGVSHITRAVAVDPVATPASPRVSGQAGGEVDATVTPMAETYPVTWTVRFGRDAEGQVIGIVDDPAVQEAVRQGFLEAWEWLWASRTPHNLADLETYFAPLPSTQDPAFQPAQSWWYGLETTEDYIEEMSASHTLPRVALADGEWEIQIERFSTDGRLAVVRGQYQDGTCVVDIVATDTGESVGGGTGRCMVYVAGMVYSQQDGRWRIASLRQRSP